MATRSSGRKLFQTYTRPKGRPLLALRVVLLIAALVATIASVKALQKKAARELAEEQRAPVKQDHPGFLMIDVRPGRDAGSAGE